MDSPTRDHPRLRRIARVILLTQGIAIAALLAVAAVLTQNVGRYEATASWVDHTHEVLTAITEIRTEVLRGGMALRDYALSGQARYLERVDGAAKAARETSVRLQDLVQHDPDQHFRAQEVHAEIEEINGWLRSSKTIAERDGLSALLQVLQARANSDGAASLRALLVAIEKEERASLRLRKDDNAAKFAAVKFLVGAAGLVFACFLAWSSFYAARLMKLSVADMDRLRTEAEHDPLTKLYNRRALEAKVARLPAGPMTVFCLDLDDFKPINDKYGHGAGDIVLQAIAGRLQQQCRGHDIVARVGGDEFVIVLPDVGDVALAKTISQRLINKLIEPIQVDNKAVRVGVSLGYAVSDGPGRYNDLVGKADAMSFVQKESKKRAKHYLELVA